MKQSIDFEKLTAEEQEMFQEKYDNLVGPVKDSIDQYISDMMDKGHPPRILLQVLYEIIIRFLVTYGMDTEDIQNIKDGVEKDHRRVINKEVVH